MSAPYPPGFLWGTATAGHQNEGGDDNADTTFLENVNPSVFREPAGRACDGFQRWQEDLDLVAALGLTAYRFSVEWSRVEPSPGTYDSAALDHYSTIVDGCLQRGLAPVVTYNHFTAPHWFAAQGGMFHADAADRFADYCTRVTEALGDRISYAITLNEPNLVRMLAWMDLPAFVHDLERATLAAASAAAGVPRYRVANVALPEEFDALQDGFHRAHVAGREAIRAARPGLPVGLSLAMFDDVALPGGEAERDRKRADVYDFWLRAVAGDDFIGVQNYEQHVFGPDGIIPAREDRPRNDMGTEVAPDSLGGAVRYAHAVSGIPVMVTEHGISTTDDSLRSAFLAPSLAGLEDAMRDGVPVLGYVHWTLMDNFEWVFGYHGQLGLHSVDRETMERTRKPSADEFARLVAERR